MQTPIYMDNHATTPVDSRVNAMLPTLGKVRQCCEPESHLRWESEAAVDLAREQIARLDPCILASGDYLYQRCDGVRQLGY